MNIHKRFAVGLFIVLLGGTAVALWWLWWFEGAKYVALHWKGLKGSNTSASPSLEELGQSGDLFGGFSALFSALAFIGILVASFLQWEQLKHARREAATAKLEADADRARAIAQHGRQTFEALFFQLIGLLRSQSAKMQVNVSSLYINSGEQTEHFDSALSRMRFVLIGVWKIQAEPDIAQQRLEILVDRFSLLYVENESRFGPYFRTIYHILKLVEMSELQDGAKVEYADIFRAQLSRDEVFLIMVNCLTPRGSGLKVLVEIYGLLKHVTRKADDGEAPDEEIAKGGFAPTATMGWLDRERYWFEVQPRPRFHPFEQH
jgi:hypothetical protein